jgi:M6 family metalloprotease-like protein
MKQSIILMLIGFWTALSYGQEMKPCGTAMLARRHVKTHTAMARQKAPEKRRVFSGEKKGLIILVEFPDVSFSSDNPLQTWSDIANKPGYNDNGAYGSVSDYFQDQSYGRFKLNFDVVGPVTAAQTHDYYGMNIDWGEPTNWFDQNVGELVEEACKGVADQVNFADYDWDDDGEVEQVFLLYAGHGENDYWRKDSTVIWPHAASLVLDWGYEGGLIVQGRKIDVYACSNEISRSNELAGMGTFCHEFSHCLGLPDLYNTKTNAPVVGFYDVMSQGSYNGGGWCPAGYSSYERYVCGWLEPLAIEDPEILLGDPRSDLGNPMSTLLRPLHLYPDACLYRTSEEANDYYLIEYREKKSWDSYLWSGSQPEGKLTAWHIDYDEEIWEKNEVNNDPEHLRVVHMPVDQVPTAISDALSEEKKIIGIYDFVNYPFVIVRYSDGTTKKVFR